MPASTTHFPSKPATERWLPTSPEKAVVHAVEDVEFLALDGVLTVNEEARSETMTRRHIVRIPRVLRQTENDSMRFTLLQKWEGVVLAMDNETFTARLMDGSGELPSQQATFARDELSTDEEGQLAVGASFVWTIGYRHVGGTRRRESEFYFRRLPAWSEEELASARQRGDQLSTSIGWK